VKKQPKAAGQSSPYKTHPALVRAGKILASYAQATGAMVAVQDQNLRIIPEMFRDTLCIKNTCLFCLQYRSGVSVEKIEDMSHSPCNTMHINAIREAHRFGGSYIYMCELGFLFWTSPLYAGGKFIGSMVGSGFLGIERGETLAQMYQFCGGSVSMEELENRFSWLAPRDSEQIRALAELMLICAKSISTGREDYHSMLRRRAEQQFKLSAAMEELKSGFSAGGPAPPYPLDKEKKLLDCLRLGNNEEGQNILNELLAALLLSNPGEYKHIQFRAIELVVLLSRIDTNPGHTDQYILETNNQYLHRIREASNIEELTDVLHMIVGQIGEQIFSFKGVRHAAALKKAERFIRENYSKKLSLEEIAAVSGLSAPYFSTIFKEEMGENLPAYLNRLRIEKAQRLLLESSLSLSDIAGLCGFEDQSWFSKIFKTYTGTSPGKYRNQGGGILSEISEDNFSQNYRSMKELHHDGSE
jgi:AraC-like DNA-binding protein/ligand-binding sensor protein